jgi:hypothetical protein
MIWACDCIEHSMNALEEARDEHFREILGIATDWTRGNATAGEARKAALSAITIANESEDPVIVAMARAVGHAAATAHMADHSIGAALYSLKAFRIAGRPVEDERKWQNEQLPEDLKDFIISARKEKEEHFKI